MTFLDILFIVFYYINFIAIILVTLGFLPQVFYYFFFWLRRKHFKKSENFHSLAIYIAAHNEERTIFHTITYLKKEMDYPKDKYRIYVCAHNCTDKTAELARKAGAIVYEYSDKEKAHHKVSYPLSYMLKRILQEDKESEVFIRFDADNIPCKSFFKEMNNSIAAGAKIVRAYEAASNMMQNVWTETCTIFSIKDSRAQNNFRQFFNMTTLAPGPGMTMTRDVVEKIDGFDCFSGIEDVEFSLKRLFEGYKIYFNTDAIVYEDQPSTYQDTKNRMVRMGRALNQIYFKDGWRMLVSFFRTGNPMYLDLLLQVQFNPVSVICFVWFPFYYAFYAILMLVGIFSKSPFSDSFFTYDLYSLSNLFTLQPTGNIIFTDPSTGAYYASYLGMKFFYDPVSCGSFSSWASNQAFIGLLNMAWVVILTISIFCIFQSFIVLFMDHQKLGLSRSLKGMWKGILLSPIYSLIYGFCNCLGLLCKPKWKVARRNPEKSDILPCIPTTEKIFFFEISEKEKKKFSGSWWKK